MPTVYELMKVPLRANAHPAFGTPGRGQAYQLLPPVVFLTSTDDQSSPIELDMTRVWSDRPSMSVVNSSQLLIELHTHFETTSNGFKKVGSQHADNMVGLLPGTKRSDNNGAVV